ncbi:MAG: cupin domain-containing protein [Bryobacteraceae bacterium]
MPVHRWDRMPEEQLNPQLARRVLHGSNMTVARLRLAKGALVPAHSHPHEQITMLLEGALRFRMPEGEIVLGGGDMLHIPPHAEHAVEALEDSVAIDLFAPVRDDWARGDDSYLRR